MTTYTALWEALAKEYPPVQDSNHKVHVHRIHLPVRYLINDDNEVVYPEGLHIVFNETPIRYLGHLGAWHSHVILFHATSDKILENAEITKELKDSARTWQRLDELVSSYYAYTTKHHLTFKGN